MKCDLFAGLIALIKLSLLACIPLAAQEAPWIPWIGRFF